MDPDQKESYYQDVADLRAENAKLRAENAKLRAELASLRQQAEAAAPSDEAVAALERKILNATSLDHPIAAVSLHDLRDLFAMVKRTQRPAPAPSALREAADAVVAAWLAMCERKQLAVMQAVLDATPQSRERP